VEVFDKVDASKSGWEEDAAALAREQARRHTLSLSDEALEIFTLSTGGDRRIMENELEKLDLYLGAQRREVTADDVRQLVPLSRAGIVFELGNAIAARDLSRAVAVLDQLLFQGETPIGIMLVAIIPTVRSLLLVKDLMARHRLSRPQQPFQFGKTLERLPAAATAHLPRKKDGTINAYALGLAAMHTQRYQTAELSVAFRACLDANVCLVTSSMEAEVVLGQLVIRIIAPARAGVKVR
jgi:DNA polymerase-3 subunit delta